MPNTTVKTRPADGTALETVRESRWPPGFIKRHGCTLKTAYTRIFKVMRDLILQCGSACGSIRKNEGTYHAKRGLLGCEADEKTSRRPGNIIMKNAQTTDRKTNRGKDGSQAISETEIRSLIQKSGKGKIVRPLQRAMERAGSRPCIR